MASLLAPIYSQFRTDARIYLFKERGEKLTLRIYDLSHKPLLKKELSLYDWAPSDIGNHLYPLGKPEASRFMDKTWQGLPGGQYDC